MCCPVGDTANLLLALLLVLNESDGISLGRILSRCQTGQGLEFANQVRLIGVARVASHAGPWVYVATLDLPVDLPKSHDAREALRGQTDTTIESPIEPPLAEAEGGCDIANGDTTARLAKEGDRARDDLIFPGDARRPQHPLHIRAPEYRCDERLGSRSPQRTEIDTLIRDLAQRQSEKWERRARTKANA